MRFRDERGDAMVEFAVVAPVLMLLILGVVQFGLWYHAQHVVQTAALEASRAAATENGEISDGEDRATAVLRAGLGGAADSSTVKVDMGAEFVSVRVETTMRGLLPIPGLNSIALNSEAVSYRERFRPRGER